MHPGPLIAILVAGLCLAFIFGALAQKLRFSPWSAISSLASQSGPSRPVSSPIKASPTNWPRSASSC